MKAKTKTQTVALRGGSELWNALFPYLAPTHIQTTRQTLLVFEPPDLRLIGGWVPYLVCGEHSSLGPHVGSMDVDVLLIPERIKPTSADALSARCSRPDSSPKRGSCSPTG